MFYYGAAPESHKTQTDSYRVYKPSYVDGLAKTVSLVSAKRDKAAFQLLLSSDSAFAVNVGKTPWFSQSPESKTYRVSADFPFKTTVSNIGMTLCDDNHHRADALLDSEVVEFPANCVNTVFVEFDIPENADAGDYNGKIKIYESYGFDDEKEVGAIDISLKVYPYVLPENKDNGFHLDLWQHLSNIARKHDVPLWSDAHFEILRPYVRSLGELGVKCVTVIASEIPWNGQGCQTELRYKANLFEYSMIPVTLKKDGKLVCDFSIMQRYIDLCAEYGVDECISVFGLVNVWDTKEYGGVRTAPDYPDGLHVRAFDEEKGIYVYLHKASELDEYIKQIEKYFIETKQLEKLRIAADEPADVEAYRKSLEHIKSVAPAFTFKTAINHAEFIGEFGKDISDFAPYISAMYEQYDALMKYKSEMPDKRFLYYVCCGPEFPNTFLRSELVESYYIGILASYTNMDGFLRWNYTVLTDDPTDIRYGNFPVGDLNFVYPSKNGGVLLTLRWKALRKGIKFFTLFNEAKKRGLKDVYDAACDLVLREKEIKKLYANWDKPNVISLDYTDYQKAEALLLEALSK